MDKSLNNISKRLEVIESQEVLHKAQIDPEVTAKQKYHEYKEHWYFHKSSWSIRGLNAYDGQGCNQFTGCVTDCKFYEKEGKLTQDEGFD